MLILSDGMDCPQYVGESSVNKPAIVPESVNVSNTDGGKALVVRHGDISICVTLSVDEAVIIANALSRAVAP